MGDVSPPLAAAQPKLRDRFEAVYHAELPYVLRTLRRLGASEAAARDLPHDVLVVFSRRADEYDRARPLRAWLFGIAYRVVGNHLSRAHRQAEIPADVSALATPDPRAATLERQAARDLLLRALVAVDLEHRAVLVLHDLEERAAPEVAAALGIPLNTVYSRLRNGRQKVAAAARRLLAEVSDG